MRERCPNCGVRHQSEQKFRECRRRARQRIGFLQMSPAEHLEAARDDLTELIENGAVTQSAIRIIAPAYKEFVAALSEAEGSLDT